MSDTTETKDAKGANDDRGSRRVIIGTITSTVMDKTVTVTVVRRVRDRRFHKFLTNRVKYHVHDEHNTGKVGDLVEIIESRPMSKTKRCASARSTARRCCASTIASARSKQARMQIS